MNVLVTIVLLAALALWGLAVYTRLANLRAQVRNAWAQLDGHQEDAHMRATYNVMVDRYNAALGRFPGYLIAPVSGFKPARRFEFRNPAVSNPPDPQSAI